MFSWLGGFLGFFTNKAPEIIYIEFHNFRSHWFSLDELYIYG